MFGKVSDDSFTHIFDLSLDSEDSRLGHSHFNTQHSYHGPHGKLNSNSSSPMSSRRDFSSSPSTPSSSSSLPLEAAFSQFAASFSSLLADKESAVSATLSLDKKISELERLRNKIQNNESTSESLSSASSTTSSNGSTNSKVNTSRYKTELCRPFSENGSCKYGEKCQFAHGQTELRTVTRHPKYKTELCRTYHSVGFCPYGPRCHFVHNMEEASQALQTQIKQAQAAAQNQNLNKPIGSGRLVGNQNLQDQKLKPLPMFDNSGWNPLNSNLFNGSNAGSPSSAAAAMDQKSRLPVFSTLSK